MNTSMKTIGTFSAGAVLAALLVYFGMSRNTPAPAESAKTDVSSPSAIATPDGATSVEPVSPVTADTAESKAKPSAMPRHESHPKPAAEKTSKTPAASSTPVAGPNGSPSTTAQNSPPPLNPSGGPVIPYDPVHSTAPPPEDKKPERKPQTVTIPAGTTFTVRVDQSLSTQRNKSGDTFRASLDQALVIDGFVIAERGARVEGRVTDSDPGGRVSGVAHLGLQLTRLSTADGQNVRLETESFAKQGPKEVKKDAAKVGAAAGIGAAIGAIAGGGKGAGLGAIIGGAAGTGGVMATHGAAAQIPAETRLTFHLSSPITITERIH